MTHAEHRPAARVSLKQFPYANVLVLVDRCACPLHCLQADALVKAGFRVIAPDLRGAIGGESDAPQEVEAYNIPKVVVKDVAGKSSIFPRLHKCPTER